KTVRAISPMAYASRPAMAQVSRYPATKIHGRNGDLAFVRRLYKGIVGATEGSIIAAIITTQIPRNQPRLPRLDQGPASMPRISRAVQTQPSAATMNNAATRPSRVRTAAYAGASPSLRPGAAGARIGDQAAQEKL